MQIPLSVKNDRSCLGCTKCCEGWLSADIYGHKIFPGKPCNFLDEASNCCSIYEKRPENPCKRWFCDWRLNLSVPEEFSPNKTGIILAYQYEGSLKYLTAANAGKEIGSEMLSWFLDYTNSNYINAEWFIDGTPNHRGSPEFLDAMKKRYSIA